MKSMNSITLKKLLDQGLVTLIDVREPQEYAEGHLANAILIPLNTLTIDLVPPSNHPIVLYCRSGKRSMTAGQNLLVQDSSLDVYSLDGGILAWQEQGYPLSPRLSSTWSIERQNQIARGALIVSSTLLGYWVHPGFYGVSGLMGAGLIYSGMTGACGLKRLLVKMPWNTSCNSVH